MSQEPVYIKEISVSEYKMDEVSKVLDMLDPNESLSLKYQGHPDNVYTFTFNPGCVKNHVLEYNPIHYVKIVYYL